MRVLTLRPEARGSLIPNARHIAGANGNLVAFFAADPPRLVIRNIVSAQPAQEIPLSSNWFVAAELAADGTVRLWRTESWTLEENGVLTGHTRGVADATFSPDGKTLASCNDDVH
jgi:WD40 repeat protein